MDKPSSVWDQFWSGYTPEDEIRMWDFYGGRQWILKHVPRHGSVVEAGCGLGRWVFYLSELGVDIEGVDFHEPTILLLRKWAEQNELSPRFGVADVSQLPHCSETVSGYLSFGVIEHFKNGPADALSEAYRVLRPGGLAIITVPTLSYSQRLWQGRDGVKGLVKRLLGRTASEAPFFQYWYTLGQLRRFVQESGLLVTLDGVCDLKYPLWELGVRSGALRSTLFAVADLLEKTPARSLGAQALAVAVKVSETMFCFLCGNREVTPEQLKDFYLPICRNCAHRPAASHYRGRRAPSFELPWQYDPPPWTGGSLHGSCRFCGVPAFYHPVFEDYGFSVPVCKACLTDPEKNLALSNEFVQPRWRPRTTRR